MLLFWFIVLDPFLSAVALAPLVVWRHGSARYHPWILAGTLFLLLTLGPPAIWRGWRGWRSARHAAPPEDAVWPPGMPATHFAARISLYLLSAGWRGIDARPIAEGHVLARAAKDRTTVALLFIAPGQHITADALRALPRAATIVTQRKVPGEERALAFAAGCTVMDAPALARGGLDRL